MINEDQPYDMSLEMTDRNFSAETVQKRTSK